MTKGTLKYIIILILAVLFTAVLTYYISDATKKAKGEDKVVEKAVEIKTDNKKEYVLTRKMNVTLLEKEYEFNIKYYGETLSNNKKVITAEVYIGEVFTGEYIYINNIVSDDKYNKIIDEYDKINFSKNALYVVNNHIVLQLSKYDEIKKTTLILYNDKLEIVDSLNISFINECKTPLLNSHAISGITFDETNLFYFKKSDDEVNLEEYKLSVTPFGFEVAQIGTLNYSAYCQ